MYLILPRLLVTSRVFLPVCLTSPATTTATGAMVAVAYVVTSNHLVETCYLRAQLLHVMFVPLMLCVLWCRQAFPVVFSDFTAN